MLDLTKMNPQQREAILTTEGPLLILAGAGSGKTRVLTHRVAHLVLDKGIDPENVLAITFTNKATNEMRERIKALVGKDVAFIKVGTFHRVCLDMLRSYHDLVGLPGKFSLVGQDDAKKIITRLCIPALLEPGPTAAAISRAKNELLTPEDLRRAANNGYKEAVARVYAEYDATLRASKVLDLDDILVECHRLLVENPDVLQAYQDLYRYIHVDEYQDTCHAQYRIVAMLAEKHKNLMVVGDDDQCLVGSTLVTMADKTKKRIDTVVVGDSVLSGHGPGKFAPSLVTRVHRHVGERRGIRITMESGEVITSTAEHTHFAGFQPGSSPQRHFVYLQRRMDIGFRIGVTRTYTDVKERSGEVLGFKTRANQEKADAVWVISTHDSEKEARIAEYTLSLTYGIPTIPFKPRPNGGQENIGDQATINKIFAALDSRTGAWHLLTDKGLSYQHPHHVPRSKNNRRNVTITLCADRGMHIIAMSGSDAEGQARLVSLGLSVRVSKKEGWRYETSMKSFNAVMDIFKRISDAFDGDVNLFLQARLGQPDDGNKISLPFTPACNVIPGMVMLDETGTARVVSEVERIMLTEPVHDIDVSQTHNFIANGIVTHNSIYGFRAADIRNILDFEKEYPGAKVVVLGTNYRSSGNILSVAGSLIMRNQARREKRLDTPNAQGSPVRHVRAEGERAESDFVAAATKALIRAGVSPADIAVLYRVATLSSDLESAFLRAGIKYEVVRGTRYVDRKIVRDAIAYINTAVHPEDEISLRRIANVPKRGLGDVTLDTLGNAAAEAEITLREAIERGAKGWIPMAPKGRAAATDLVDTLTKVKAATALPRLVAQVKAIIEASGLLNITPKSDTPDQDSAGDLMKLADIADALVEEKPDADLTDLLDFLALQSEADDKAEDSAKKVKLLTIHASKGLEFHSVFVVGIEEGIMPHRRAIMDPNPAIMEEERRLAYVAMTRAKSNLTLSSVATRRLYGERRSAMASRFLQEIPDYLIKRTRT